MALISKYLLGGISLTGVSSGFMFYEREYGVLSVKEEEIDNFVEGEEEAEELIRKVGLVCSGQYCYQNRKKKLNVERDKRDENVSIGYWPEGKIRIHRGSEGYLGGLRFTIEGSKIPLYMRKAWMEYSVASLEEFENYGIKKDGGKYYLSRTKNSSEGKILELGLPNSCTLPKNGEISCKVLHVEGVKFGSGLDAHVDGETSLTITEKTKDQSFEGDYKFTFTFPQDVTINGRVIRAKSPIDFRLKRHDDGHLTLEKAWENEKELLDKVGLECGADGNCSLKSGGTLKIKKAADGDFLNISDISPGRIRLYRYDEDYLNGLRLQVEGGKIGDGDNALEEYETYEIEENGDEYYLLLKKKSEERIGEILKYPCSLSITSPDCSILNERSFKAINFEGKEENLISIQDKNVVIRVSKASEEDFPLGWRFTITSSEKLDISSSNSIKANAPTDFKLKKHDNGGLSLERAWASENDLAGKVGLGCDESDNCSLKSGETLNIKKGGKDIQISELGEGKIKLYKETSGYSNGLKFAIEEKNIGTGENVLEEFETYEIKEIGGKYYLVLKTNAEKRIKELLNFPSRCSDTSECDKFKEDEFKNINFEGKDESLISLENKTVKITISTAPEDDFPLSRKFTIESSGELKISDTTKVKANSPTDFKIKRHEGGRLTLEKAWSEEKKLIEKVGLDCTDNDNCTIKNGSITLRKNDKDIVISSLGDGGKIKLYKESDNYSNSLKFAIEDGNITAEKDTIEEFETYEIKENKGGYYLGLKTNAEEKIKELLGYPSKCSSLSSCDKLTKEEVEKINFKDKSESSISLENGKTVKITVSKTSESDFTLGRKFIVTSSGDLKESDSIFVKANAPTEFKIKKEGTSKDTTLSLEKAWDLQSLSEKVGLSCSTDNDNCTITSGNLNVKIGGSLLKGLSGGGEQSKGKIKVIKDQEGYNEGFKFQIQDGNISLSSEGSQPGNLEEFESYEIKNEGENYYLNRKETAIQGKWKALGLPAKCQSYAVNQGCKIDDAELGKIKFLGKDATKQVTIDGARVYLKTFEETRTNFPLGIRVNMEVKAKNVKIPKEKSGSIILWEEFETEFRVKKVSDGNYSLEGTFDMNALVKKIGIENGNCDDELGCTVGSKINVYRSGTQYRRDATVAHQDQNKKITYQRGVASNKKFNNNIIFTVPAGGIKLTGTGEVTKSIGNFNNNSIDAGTYDIREHSLGQDKSHYLSWWESRAFDIK